jgi:hypothetical protein
MWVDVDTAVTVPVNVLSLVDDTDFKSREVAIAYNQAGMDLVWNFQTAAGVTSQTAVTPTTGGVYDWTHSGDGMYKIEIPASGGASINNDTEGTGWFTGFCTGVLPWRGPFIGFRAAGLNDALMDSAYSTTRGLAGTALPNAAAEAAGGLYTRGTGAGQINQETNGRVDVNVHAAAGTAWGSGAITAASIATDAIGSAEIAASAVTKIQNGLATSIEVGDVETLVATRLAASSYTTPPTAAAIADQVWEETLADHSGTAGSTAAALNAAGSAGDPWSTALPGAYGAGTAGKIIGDNINATISSRATPAQVATELNTYDAPTNAEMVARTLAAADYATAATLALVKAKTDTIPASPAAVGDIPTAVQNADALLARNINGGSSTGRTVKQAMKRLRNKVAAPGGAMTVYDEDDTTPNWTATLTTTAGNPVSEVDPA